MSLTTDQAIKLNTVLTCQGVKTDGLRAENPFDSGFSKTPRGRQIQMMIEAADPQLAQDLMAASGSASHTPSLAYVAATNQANFDPSQLTGAVAQEWRQRNPALVAEQQQKAEADLLQKLDSMTDQSRRRREGDTEVDRQSAKAKAEAEARKESLLRHQQQQQRIQARQQRMDAMNPGFL